LIKFGIEGLDWIGFGRGIWIYYGSKDVLAYEFLDIWFNFWIGGEVEGGIGMDWMWDVM